MTSGVVHWAVCQLAEDCDVAGVTAVESWGTGVGLETTSAKLARRRDEDKKEMGKKVFMVSSLGKKTSCVEA